MTYHGRDLPIILWEPELNRAIHDALPGTVVDALALLTRLGDGATLVGLAVLLYWFGAESDRHQRAMVLAVAVATLALVAGLKGILEVQRPLFAASPPLEFAPETYEGWSTPSAHATGAAAVYGALAAVTDIGKRWQRYAVAGFIIGIVSFSRIALGLHYVGDVVLGVVLGLLLVAIALRITKRSITPMFVLSFAIALGALVLGSEEFTEMAIGSSLGGAVVWQLLKDRESNPLGASMTLLGLLVLPAFVLVRVLNALVAIDGGITFAGAVSVSFVAIAQTIGYALAFGIALAVPFVATALNDTELVRKLQTILPFRERTIDPTAVGEEPIEDETIDS